MAGTRNIMTAAVCLAAPLAVSASQVTLTFSAPGGGGSGVESQFRCVVTDLSPTMASFRFSNEVGLASSVMQVGIARSKALGTAGTLVQDGCSFTTLSAAATPGALPFRVSQLYSAEFGDDPTTGLDAMSDRLEVRLPISAGYTFQDVVTEIRKGNVQLAMGLPTASGGTEWFLNDPTDSIVPLPPAATAGAALLGALGVMRLRRRGR